MPILSTLAAQLQSVTELPQEGLPFWLFWFLLSVIVLLLAFIFLRDKDLRLRMSAFLSGAKRRLLRLRLQAKVRKQKERLAQIRSDLGRKIWSDDVPVDGTGDLRHRLQVLQEDIARNQAKWQEVDHRIEALSRGHAAHRQTAEAELRELETARVPLADRLEEARSRRHEIGREREQARKDLRGAERQEASTDREIQTLEAKVRPGDESGSARLVRAREKAEAAAARKAELQAKLGALAEESDLLDAEEPGLRKKLEAIDGPRAEITRALHERTRIFEKKLRRWENARKKIQDRILELKGRTEPLFEDLGRAADDARTAHPELTGHYTRIDAADQAVRELTDRIRSLQ